jgi:hypothetical protein
MVHAMTMQQCAGCNGIKSLSLTFELFLLVGSDQEKVFSLWGNSEENQCQCERQFWGRNCL